MKFTRRTAGLMIAAGAIGTLVPLGVLPSAAPWEWRGALAVALVGIAVLALGRAAHSLE